MAIPGLGTVGAAGQTGPVSIAVATVPAPAPVRELSVAVGERGVLALTFHGGHRWLERAAGQTGQPLVEDRDRTAPVVEQLTDYLAGRRETFDVEVDWSLTAGNARTVLETLYREVGYGWTTTYGELAQASGAFDDPVVAARAVGTIMGSNPIPVIVPCHRVLAADGLGGFGGGLPTKRWLLELEGALPPTLDF